MMCYCMFNFVHMAVVIKLSFAQARTTVVHVVPIFLAVYLVDFRYYDGVIELLLIIRIARAY